MNILQERLEKLYGAERAPALAETLESRIRDATAQIPSRHAGWDQTDTFLITYADSLNSDCESPLASLRQFLTRHLDAQISIVHLLPFFPWTSDDGFSVVDYRAVNPDVGSWEDVRALADERRVCFDAVVNHVSQESEYVQGYLRGEAAYDDFVIALDPETDTSAVTRPRNLPLLHAFPHHDGKEVWLWTTFSRDQVDLNFGNPAVLLEIIDVLLFYAANGASLIRLDAIPFLWKELGTSCSHLPQTHEAVKLFRDVMNRAAPHVILLTETNVPHGENISYFGNAGDEAQMIYNFSLAPLIIWSLYTGNAEYLSTWARQITHISDETTYLNITATHDGIGLRPTEGILTDAERAELVAMVKARGGKVSEKRNPDGSTSPYELNITYFDAINDPNAETPLAEQVERFMVSQTIAMSFKGMPGIYIHSLLGSRNDLDGVAATGRARSINRAVLHSDALEQELHTPDSLRSLTLNEYKRRLTIRTQQSAFHPNAAQSILALDTRVFALERRSNAGQRILALHNISGETVTVSLPTAQSDAVDLLGGDSPVKGDSLTLAPYQCCWISSMGAA